MIILPILSLTFFEPMRSRVFVPCSSRLFTFFSVLPPFLSFFCFSLLYFSRQATKEGAYLQALGTAGIMYTLTKNCRLGSYKECACVPVDRPAAAGNKWRWKGCNENLNFGETLTKTFLDGLERQANDAKRSALNQHNNEIGRKVGNQNHCDDDDDDDDGDVDDDEDDDDDDDDDDDVVVDDDSRSDDDDGVVLVVVMVVMLLWWW